MEKSWLTKHWRERGRERYLTIPAPLIINMLPFWGWHIGNSKRVFCQQQRSISNSSVSLEDLPTPSWRAKHPMKRPTPILEAPSASHGDDGGEQDLSWLLDTRSSGHRARLAWPSFSWGDHCSGSSADLHHRGGHPGQCLGYSVSPQEQKAPESWWVPNMLGGGCGYYLPRLA